MEKWVGIWKLSTISVHCTLYVHIVIVCVFEYVYVYVHVYAYMYIYVYGYEYAYFYTVYVHCTCILCLYIVSAFSAWDCLFARECVCVCVCVFVFAHCKLLHYPRENFSYLQILYSYERQPSLLILVWSKCSDYTCKFEASGCKTLVVWHHIWELTSLSTHKLLVL